MQLTSLCHPVPGHGGEWRVKPIRLDLDRGSKSGVITVVNESDEKINFQISVLEWTQDAEGKDQYTETGDIVFFPKIMSLDKKEEKVIRAGIKNPQASREKTYRLFIEEIPKPRNDQTSGVAILMRFGVPIFVKPLQEVIKGEITQMELAGGNFSFTVKNTGTSNFNIKSLTITGSDPDGKQLFAKELNGWYLLSGAVRRYSSPLTDDCAKAKRLELGVKTDKSTFTGSFDVDKSKCKP